MKYIFKFLLLGLITLNAYAQNGEIRGVLFDKSSGEPIIFTNVVLKENGQGSQTDINGFFSLPQLLPGEYTIYINAVGYDSIWQKQTVNAGETVSLKLFMVKSAINLSEIKVSAKKEEKKTTSNVSTIKITQKDIKQLPSAGGVADVAQYIQVIPGVVSTGDQGGQLYIRGGSPVQNKVVLDGMTIFSPFHSIGFFSVFETDLIRNVDVYTGGFNADKGGRISSIIDITTREGNKKRLGGSLTVSPFLSKFVFEGPIKKFDEETGSSSSFVVSAKHSYLNQTSKNIYSYSKKYIERSLNNEPIDVSNDYVLPFSFTDIYGKLSLNGNNGSKANIYGFVYDDKVNYDVAAIDWRNIGGGANFVLVPKSIKMVIDGAVNVSNYKANFKSYGDNYPRKSEVGAFSVQFNFGYYIKNGIIKYGIEAGGGNTNFLFFNSLGIITSEEQFTTDLGTYAMLRKNIGKFVLEPGIRFQYYASLNTPSFEPRFNAKFNAHKNFRVKFSTGLYSQNLISANNERNVVNIFQGFLQGPDSKIPGANDNLQRSIQLIGGIEWDVTENLEINIEPYQKIFPQILNLKGTKQSVNESNFNIEKGRALGIDFLAKYRYKGFYLWTSYSWSKVEFNDGSVYYNNYPPNFDRRHNVNVLVSYNFGKNKDWEASVRYNYGTGFPFTRIVGNYPYVNFQDGSGNYLLENPQVGTIYEKVRNAGRLPSYARLDASIKKEFGLGQFSKLEVIASVTNALNRQNIFYADAIRKKRINQLPILPSIAVNLMF